MMVLKIPNAPIRQKIKKPSPFDLSMITMDFPYFAQVLAHAVGQIKELPDFSDDKKIAVQGKFLSKITIQISKLASGELGSGVVDFTPAKGNN